MKLKLFVLVLIVFVQTKVNSYKQSTTVPCTRSNAQGYNGTFASSIYLNDADKVKLAGYGFINQFICDENNKFHIDTLVY